MNLLAALAVPVYTIIVGSVQFAPDTCLIQYLHPTGEITEEIITCYNGDFYNGD
jgi:hypothetical protein